MMLLKIVQAGHPVLRERARPMTREEVNSADVALLIELMRETMRDAPGVGLAAPQIGESIQLVVIEDSEERMTALSEDDRNLRERKPVPFQVLINPELEVIDATEAEFYEGCLSVPGFFAVVPRALGVRVKALDHRGEEKTLDARGWFARILQHEIDHLKGTLCIDRMQPRTFSTAENLGKFAKR
jgi:peptide deformylase